MKVQFSPQSKFSGRSTLLLVGSGVLADTLAKHLATPEVEVVRTARDRMFEVVAPGAVHCMVLVGDAASERGGPLIRETVQRLGAGAPLMVVVSAPQIGGLSPQPMPAGAALLTPEGGMVECARRLRATLERIHGGGLEQTSLQDLLDQTSRKATNAGATQKIGASLAPVVARVETQPNLGASSGTARVEAPRQPVASAAVSRPRQQTLLGSTPSGIAPVARPQSTPLDVRANGAPAAVGGGKSPAVSSIADAVSNALAADQAPPVEMMWGEATPTVVARTRPRQPSGRLELPPGEVELVIGDAEEGSETDAAGAMGSADAPSPSRAPEMPAKLDVWGSRGASVSGPASALDVQARPRQPTLHGQAPLSLSALASAGGAAVGVEVRIRTSSTSAMKRVTAPEPSGSLPPTAAGPSRAPEPQAAAPALERSEPPVVTRTEASVEVSLASLEPPAVSFSESTADFSENPEAPTPIAISIPVRTHPEAGAKRARLDGIVAKARRLFARSADSAPELEASTDSPTQFASEEASAARPRRSASRSWMTAVLVLALGGGAAAAFEWMRLSGDTQAHAPAAALGALAKVNPEASRVEQPARLVGTAKSAGPDSSATQKGPHDREPARVPAAAVQAGAAPSNEGSPTFPPGMPAAGAAVQPGAAANEAAAVQPGSASSDVDATAEATAAHASAALQADDSDDSQPVAPAPNPAVKRAERLVDEGLSLAKQGRFGLAEAAHLRALRVFPKYPRALAGLVRVHLARKDGAEAVRWAKRLTARQPSRAQNHLLLGDAQALRGDAKAARRAWTRAARNGSATARTRLKSANAKS